MLDLLLSPLEVHLMVWILVGVILWDWRSSCILLSERIEVHQTLIGGGMEDFGFEVGFPIYVHLYRVKCNVVHETKTGAGDTSRN